MKVEKNNQKKKKIKTIRNLLKIKKENETIKDRIIKDIRTRFDQ